MRPRDDIPNLVEFTDDGFEQLSFSVIMINLKDYYYALCSFNEYDFNYDRTLTKQDKLNLGCYRNRMLYAKKFFNESPLGFFIAECYLPNTHLPDLTKELDRKFIRTYGIEAFNRAISMYEYINKLIPVKSHYHTTGHFAKGQQYRSPEALEAKREYIRQYRRQKYRETHANVRPYKRRKRKGQTP